MLSHTTNAFCFANIVLCMSAGLRPGWWAHCHLGESLEMQIFWPNSEYLGWGPQNLQFQSTHPSDWVHIAQSEICVWQRSQHVINLLNQKGEKESKERERRKDQGGDLGWKCYVTGGTASIPSSPLGTECWPSLPPAGKPQRTIKLCAAQLSMSPLIWRCVQTPSAYPQCILGIYQK